MFWVRIKYNADIISARADIIDIISFKVKEKIKKSLNFTFNSVVSYL
jgi:hypothetical protein